MGRDGSGVYHRPPGTDAVPDTTIESSKYNAYVADIEQDLNLPRPIVAGGTGANNALQAMQNLGGEIAKQIITNYSSAPWVNGSFYSAAGATGAPTANRFAGIYYENADGSYATIEARDQTTGILYVQQKVAGVWSGTWLQGPGSLTDTDARYVNVAGDTMTGDLRIGKANPALFMDKAVSGQVNSLVGTLNGTTRWMVVLGDQVAEGGSNVGSDFVIQRYTDAGGLVDNILSIARNSGVATFNKAVAANAAVWSVTAPTTGTFQFGNSGTKSLSYDGTSYNLTGGPLYVGPLASGLITGDICAARSATTGYYFFGSSTKSLGYDGTNFNLAGGNLISPNHYIRDVATPTLQFQNTSGGVGTQMFHGLASGVFTLANVAAGGLGLFIDISGNLNVSTGTAYKPGGGSWTAPSDERIKTVIGDYTPGLDAITQLAPRRFTYKGNDTPTSDVSMPLVPPAEGEAAPKINAAPYPSSPNYDPASKGTEFIGLIAQEIEAIFPGMVTTRSGYIDGEAIDDLRVVDTTPLIYALVNAVKELSAKIVALEAK